MLQWKAMEPRRLGVAQIAEGLKEMTQLGGQREMVRTGEILGQNGFKTFYKTQNTERV